MEHRLRYCRQNQQQLQRRKPDMLTKRTLRTNTGLMALAIFMFLFALNLNGCSENEDSPTAVVEATPPLLPVAEQFQFDLSFFDSADSLEKASGDYDNFINAYLRAVVLEAVANLVLAAPVGTFSAALNTVPEAMDDGSWVWTYDWHYGPDPLTISLRGLPAGDVVEWEMSLAPTGSDLTVLWFSGTTNGNGSEGRWTFHDLDTDGYPVSGEISWGASNGSQYLQFVSREPGSDGDVLRFNDNDPDFSIEFSPGDGDQLSFLRWQASGAGSLRVPDYNDGLEGCWDVYQRNVDCQ